MDFLHIIVFYITNVTFSSFIGLNVKRHCIKTDKIMKVNMSNTNKHHTSFLHSDGIQTQKCFIYLFIYFFDNIPLNNPSILPLKKIHKSTQKQLFEILRIMLNQYWASSISLCGWSS